MTFTTDNRLVLASQECSVQVVAMDSVQPTMLHSFPPMSDSINLLSVSGNVAAAADLTGEIHLYNLTKGKVCMVLCVCVSVMVSVLPVCYILSHRCPIPLALLSTSSIAAAPADFTRGIHLIISTEERFIGVCLSVCLSVIMSVLPVCYIPSHRCQISLALLSTSSSVAAAADFTQGIHLIISTEERFVGVCLSVCLSSCLSCQFATFLPTDVRFHPLVSQW